jgi:hypothetical protein
LVLKYRGDLHRYIQTERDFLYISSLVVSYRYVVKIKKKFKHQNKREFGSENLQQPKYDKDDPNKQFPENQSKPQENKGHGKMKKDTKKWCDFHKILTLCLGKGLCADLPVLRIVQILPSSRSGSFDSPLESLLKLTHRSFLLLAASRPDRCSLHDRKMEFRASGFRNPDVTTLSFRFPDLRYPDML